MKSWLSVLFIAALSVHAFAAGPLPWGDQGDGTFRNPILPADYSDPDVIRVGDDFYMVASEFHFMGMQVLHSRDLVNWRIIGQVYDRLGFDAKYAENRAYAQGTWAPALRYRDGTFSIYVCTPRDGLLRYTAKNPAGPWTGGLIKAVDQWEDPCPFWDDDGAAYLVHSKLGAGPLILHRMSPDGTQLLDEGVEIYHGPVAEGPKLFKRNGWYYISLPEGGVERGGQTVLRAKNIYGPYERRVVLPDGSPHQGGLVELDNGEAWFIGFKSAGHLGRVPMLQPVKWVDDWPVFGDGGRPVMGGQKPALPRVPIEHPQVSDEFETASLSPQWQWNHNPVDGAWSLTERAGWLRLKGRPAANLELARGTLTQKLWGQAGSFEVKLDGAALSEGQRAGVAFMSGKMFSAVGLERRGGTTHVYWEDYAPVPPGSPTANPPQTGRTTTGSAATGPVWLRGEYHGDVARLSYSTDGKAFTDTGLAVKLRFGQWKGARLALFCYGAGRIQSEDAGGGADFDYFRFTHGRDAVPVKLPDATPIDREALVRRHNPVVRSVDYDSPLTVGNGGFAFTADITGLQTFAYDYHRHGVPTETQARWAWVSDENPHNYTLADASTPFTQGDGRIVLYPNRQSSPAGDWLRKNPRAFPVGQLQLVWDKPDGSAFTPADIEEPEQTLDLWSGILTSRFKLGGVPVTVTTACDPHTDTVAVRLHSALAAQGRLHVLLAFPRGHDINTKNTPALDWSQPETHTSKLSGGMITRSVSGLEYQVMVHAPATTITRRGPHGFLISMADGHRADTMEITAGFYRRLQTPARYPLVAEVIAASAAQWQNFWRTTAAVDFSGSTNPLAEKFEKRIVLSRYLTAVQCVGDVPPQESGLTCNTWYGKHHTEMIWWHTAHFALWGHAAALAKNLEWFISQLPAARALASSRGLKGARWAKMTGPEMRESPGGNPFIVWNQPHPIYLAELLYRNSRTPEVLAHYRDLVFETADCLATMVHWNESKKQYDLGPPLWIAQEIYDQATSQNPSFELAYWRWALGLAQQWRERLGLPRVEQWDHVIAHLAPMPEKDGKYVALGSHPDTWDNLDSRHDHPTMLAPIGLLPPQPPYTDRPTMERTLDAVLAHWDWAAKIWGWDYPMIAMTAARLGRPKTAVEILLRDGPNNLYLPNGHAPVRSDTKVDPNAPAGARKREIAVYLPANGSFLAAAALMIAGWDGCAEEFPGIPKDGTWRVRAEGLRRLP